MGDRFCVMFLTGFMAAIQLGMCFRPFVGWGLMTAGTMMQLTQTVISAIITSAALLCIKAINAREPTIIINTVELFTDDSWYNDAAYTDGNFLWCLYDYYAVVVYRFCCQLSIFYEVCHLS